METLTPITGARKAAILMAILGEEAASAILRQLDESDVYRVTEELSSLGKIPVEQAAQILEEYYKLAATQELMAQGGRSYTSKVLAKAFGEDTAKELLDKVSVAHQKASSRAMVLQTADPQQLAGFLEGEHPQTVALVLGHLRTKQASAVLMNLSDDVRGEVVRRLANLNQFSPEMTDEISSMLGKKIQSMGEQTRHSYEGFKTVADLMNNIDSSTASEILQSIERAEPQLAISIRNQMFTFEDFLQVPEQGLRELMGALDRKILTMALKSASTELKNQIFKTMSSRAVEMLKEDMEALGPVRSREVVAAQQEVIELARQLESEGKLVLRSEGDDEYIV